MPKVVINRCYGGFGLSDLARERLGIEKYRELPRDDPRLVAVVEELGDAADGRHASLAVVEIPDDVEWTIEEYDGIEWVAEAHRTWS